MAKVCMKCYEIYKESLELEKGQYNFCPKNNCIGEVVEIDELMLPTILMLNKKGYKTKYCCSGHYGEKDPNVYIKFEPGIILPIIPAGYSESKDISTKEITIRTRIREGNLENLCKNAIDLEKWALSMRHMSEDSVRYNLKDGIRGRMS